MDGSTAEPVAFTTTAAATVAPPGVTRSAYPNPPLIPPHLAPVPAPTRARGRAFGGGRRQGPAAEVGGRPVAEDPAPVEVEDHRRGHDRHDLAGLGADGKADAGLLQAGHHPVGGGQPVRAAAGEHDRVHALDHRGRVEQIGLPGAGPAAAYVHPADRAGAGQNHRGPGQPAVAVSRAVPDLETVDHQPIVVLFRRRGMGPVSGSR